MRKLEVTELNRISAEEFKVVNKLPLVVVLDNVRSLHNVGSVFRTSDAFLVEKIVLCGITSCPPNAEIHKTALGAEYSVEWEYFENTLEAVELLKNEGYCIYSIEQVENSTMLDEIKLDKNPQQKYAVILGNEVHGVAQEVVDASDDCIEIPQFGTKHSLNVSVSAGLIIWKFFELLK
ncbi:MAG: RNA methyltransferase [Paludibacteraceae bacterium]|nr:RNA methyltransferase [Bacteroidales bacterium]MBR6658891.1 RNA methyltransferase [Paludibacteraceae bacterium]